MISIVIHVTVVVIRFVAVLHGVVHCKSSLHFDVVVWLAVRVVDYQSCLVFVVLVGLGFALRV